MLPIAGILVKLWVDVQILKKDYVEHRTETRGLRDDVSEIKEGVAFIRGKMDGE